MRVSRLVYTLQLHVNCAIGLGLNDDNVSSIVKSVSLNIAEKVGAGSRGAKTLRKAIERCHCCYRSGRPRIRRNRRSDWLGRAAWKRIGRSGRKRRARNADCRVGLIEVIIDKLYVKPAHHTDFCRWQRLLRAVDAVCITKKHTVARVDSRRSVRTHVNECRVWILGRASGWRWRRPRRPGWSWNRARRGCWSWHSRRGVRAPGQSR
jgi:hypothetical protein